MYNKSEKKNIGNPLNQKQIHPNDKTVQVHSSKKGGRLKVASLELFYMPYSVFVCYKREREQIIFATISKMYSFMPSRLAYSYEMDVYLSL